MEGKFLLFDSRHQSKIVGGKIEDGEAVVGDKKFAVDKTEPFMLKQKKMGMFETHVPLYIVKWDEAKPLTLSQVENIDEIDIDSDELTPGELNALSETNLLIGLIRGKGGLLGGTKSAGLMLIVGLIVGTIAMYMATYFNIITI